MRERTGALLNGALMALGASALFDVVVIHGTLGWHTAVPGPWAEEAEVGLLIVGVVMLAVGIIREARARTRAPG